MSSPADTADTVLIVSEDATAAALLGGLVELLGYRVQFAPVEGMTGVGGRMRPRAAMLDCEAVDTCTDRIIGRATMRGIGVVLVGPRDVLVGLRDLVTRHGVEIVVTPPEPGPLGEALHRAIRRVEVIASPAPGTSTLPRTSPGDRP